MSQIVGYHCPNCGGAITFSSAQQQMVCPYCQTALSLESLEGIQNEAPTFPEDAPEQPQWNSSNQPWQTDANQMQVYQCRTCGGEIVAEMTLGATSCPFCGNPVIVSGLFSGGLQPDLIIPFQLDRNAAVETLKKLYDSKKLLPKVFSKQSHIDDIKGVYIPFWLFSSDVEGQVFFSCTRVRSWSDSRYQYTETSYYDVFRSGLCSFEHVPVDGASQVKNKLTESIEPYDYRGLKPFQLPYLSGFFANRYDVSANQSAVIATNRMKNSTEQAIRSSVAGYSSVTVRSSRVGYRNARVLYALLPAWLLTTIWRGKSFTFAMNGQTGKMAGDDLPVDWGAFWSRFFLTMACVTAALFGVLWLILRSGLFGR